MNAAKAKAIVLRDTSVSVHVTPEVMFDLAKAQQVQKNVLGRLGCPSCPSGFNINLLALESEFTVDARLNVSPTGAG